MKHGDLTFICQVLLVCAIQSEKRRLQAQVSKYFQVFCFFFWKMDDHRWDNIFSRVKQHLQNNQDANQLNFNTDEQIADSMIQAISQMPSTSQGNF